ncbi:MAG: OmpA family protein [Prevotella sp.]|nr:OmpA family protein [Prevotella sp.]
MMTLLMVVTMIISLPLSASPTRTGDMSTSSEKQETAVQSHRFTGWYAGVQGGIPFGYSSFSSFAADKTYLGFSATLLGGYRWSNLLSLELQAGYGRITMGQLECCANKGYWLGEDGGPYITPILGMNGWHESNLKSEVSLLSGLLQLNVNVLSLLPSLRESRWRVELSPRAGIIGTEAKVKTIGSGEEAMKGDRQWQWAAGGQAHVSYALTPRLDVGLYSNLTYIFGDQIDGLPKRRHEGNHLWESGLRLSWSFGSDRAKAAYEAEQEVLAAEQARLERERSEAEALELARQQEEAARLARLEAEREAAAKAKAEAQRLEAERQAALAAADTLPVTPVYFAFNSKSLSRRERVKLQSVADFLQKHPDVKVVVHGWCDAYGAKSVNRRISRQRAQNVRMHLMRLGIARERIAVRGRGSDYRAATAALARRAVTIETRKEAQR